jgi:hypothetical protein
MQLLRDDLYVHPGVAPASSDAALTGLYRFVPWGEYERQTTSAESVRAWELEKFGEERETAGSAINKLKAIS